MSGDDRTHDRPLTPGERSEAAREHVPHPVPRDPPAEGPARRSPAGGAARRRGGTDLETDRNPVPLNTTRPGGSIP